MAFTYFLPDENGNKTEHGTTSNAVIIIGANGSGKSKLGAWIEQQNMEQKHFVSVPFQTIFVHTNKLLQKNVN